MASMTLTKHVDAPPDRVFAASADIPNWAENVEGVERVEMLTDGPVGVGTRFRETRIMFKKEATEEMEVTTFDPPTSYTLECESCGAHYCTVTTVRPDGEGSVIELTMKTTPVSFMAKVMMIASPLFSGMMKKCIAKDLDDLANHIEGGPGAEASAAPA